MLLNNVVDTERVPPFTAIPVSACESVALCMNIIAPSPSTGSVACVIST